MLVVVGLKCIQDERLKVIGVLPTEDDFAWTDIALYPDEIKEVYKKTNTKLVLEFYDDRPSLTIKDNFEQFLKKLEASKNT